MSIRSFFARIKIRRQLATYSPTYGYSPKLSRLCEIANSHRDGKALEHIAISALRAIKLSSDEPVDGITYTVSEILEQLRDFGWFEGNGTVELHGQNHIANFMPMIPDDVTPNQPYALSQSGYFVPDQSKNNMPRIYSDQTGAVIDIKSLFQDGHD